MKRRTPVNRCDDFICPNLKTPNEKKTALLSIESWLVNRNPYSDLL